MGFIIDQLPDKRIIPERDGRLIPNSLHVGQANGSGQTGSGGSGSGFISNTTDPILQAIDKINNDSGFGNVTDENGNVLLSGEDRYLAELGIMKGLNTNFSHSNKWVGYFPLANVLGKKYSNLEMNLKRVSIPQMVMGSTTTSFKGYTFEMPTKLIDADSKEIVIEYIVDERWQNYKSLFLWCSATTGQINQVVDTSSVENISMTDFIDCRIWLIDSFKNRILDFVFENCWIKNFQDLSLEASNAEEVNHTITLAYSNFYIDTNNF